MKLEEELSELQEALATVDYLAAIASRQHRSRDPLAPLELILKVLQQIKIRMDGNKNHKRPHVHIDYGRQFHAASYAIDTGERLAGVLDKGYDRAVSEWILRHRPKLFEVWERMQAGENAEPIASELRGSL